MTIDAPPPPPPVTEEAFDAWCTEDVWAELVDGRVILKDPPTIHHVRIVGFLIQLLGVYLGKQPLGELLGPEYLIRLRPGLRRSPDLLFVRSERRHLFTEMWLEGAPDAVWEVVSRDSMERDWREKYYEYQASGVHEYWIIDPMTRNFRLYHLTEGGYETAAPQMGRFHSQLLPGFWVRAEWFWQDPLPNLIECLRELNLYPA